MAENGNDARFSPESKVGLFVLAGLAILMISILMLGDIHFRPQNTYYVIFRNVEGIAEKSVVKISGVEIGSVKKVSLVDDHATITVALRKDIKLYKNAKARIRSTGIIGSKFLAFDPGSLQPGIPEDAQRLNTGDTILGEDALTLDELMERVAKSLDDFTGKGKAGENLNATIANLRSITDSLNAALGQQRKSLINIVKNIEGFSSYAKSAAAHLDEVLSENKEEFKLAMHNLKETLEKSNSVLGEVQKGEGVFGTLLYDRKAGEEMKQTVSNLKQTSESAKAVLARFTKVRAFWVFNGQRDFDAEVYRGEIGLRLEPRPNKFYELMVQNVGDQDKMDRNLEDTQRANTILALIGRNWGPYSVAIGSIKSAAGIDLRYRPFQDTEIPVANRMEIHGRATDFSRDAIRNGHHLKGAEYDAGVRFKVNQWVQAGLQYDDIAEMSNLHGVINFSFEDKDLAYLLGFVSFAR